MSKFGLIDFRGLGLGDCVAGLLVLAHLCDFDSDLDLNTCVVIVPRSLLGISEALLGRYGLEVRVDETSKSSAAGRRRLVLRPPKSLREAVQDVLGGDRYLNWAEFCEMEASWREQWETRSPVRKLRFRILQATQFEFASPKTSAPVYIGFRLLSPIIRQSKFTLTTHIFHSKRTFPKIRNNIKNYINSFAAAVLHDRELTCRKLVFPGSESFGAMPISMCVKLQERFGSALAFVLHESDFALPEARKVLRQLSVVSSVEETLYLLTRNYAISVDSFVSHLIQLTNDEAIILFGRELKERFVHPGARPRVLEAYPECAPCVHRSKRKYSTCPAGRSECVAFETLYRMLITELSRDLGETEVN